MEITTQRTVKILAVLVLLTALAQPLYTALYYHAPSANRHILWGVEGLLFVLLAAFAGSALGQSKRFALGFSAIAFASVLNVVQVGVGLTQFGPFREAAQANPDFAPTAGAIVAFSFFGYNAAKILLGLAAVVFGFGLLGKSQNSALKALGGVTLAVGIAAFIANTLVMMFGIRGGFIPRSWGGMSGVVATLLLALTLFPISKKLED